MEAMGPLLPVLVTSNCYLLLVMIVRRRGHGRGISLKMGGIAMGQNFVWQYNY